MGPPPNQPLPQARLTSLYSQAPPLHHFDLYCSYFPLLLTIPTPYQSGEGRAVNPWQGNAMIPEVCEAEASW